MRRNKMLNRLLLILTLGLFLAPAANLCWAVTLPPTFPSVPDLSSPLVYDFSVTSAPIEFVGRLSLNIFLPTDTKPSFIPTFTPPDPATNVAYYLLKLENFGNVPIHVLTFNNLNIFADSVHFIDGQMWDSAGSIISSSSLDFDFNGSNEIRGPTESAPANSLNATFVKFSFGSSVVPVNTIFGGSDGTNPLVPWFTQNGSLSWSEAVHLPSALEGAVGANEFTAPEPATLFLLGSGILLAAAFRRKVRFED